MITRIRVEADGASAREVEEHLHAVANYLEPLLGGSMARGDQHIQQENGEPNGSRFAFQGRMTLHPDTSSDAPQIASLLERKVSVTVDKTPWDLGGVILHPVTQSSGTATVTLDEHPVTLTP